MPTSGPHHTRRRGALHRFVAEFLLQVRRQLRDLLEDIAHLGKAIFFGHILDFRPHLADLDQPRIAIEVAAGPNGAGTTIKIATASSAQRFFVIRLPRFSTGGMRTAAKRFPGCGRLVDSMVALALVDDSG